MTDFFPTCQDIFLTVAAGLEEVRAVNGEVLAIIAATSSFELAFDSGSLQYADAGFTYKGHADGGPRPRFSQLRFKNPNAFPINVRVQVSNGEIFDNRAIFGSGSVPVVFAPSQVYLPRENVPEIIERGTALTIPAGTSGLLYAANAARYSAIVENISTETMVISDSTGTLNHGIPIRAGERIEVRSKGNLRAYNPASFTQSLGRCEIRWS